VASRACRNDWLCTGRRRCFSLTRQHGTQQSEIRDLRSRRYLKFGD
jgi:hypothetical protein